MSSFAQPFLLVSRDRISEDGDSQTYSCSIDTDLVTISSFHESSMQVHYPHALISSRLVHIPSMDNIFGSPANSSHHSRSNSGVPDMLEVLSDNSSVASGHSHSNKGLRMVTPRRNVPRKLTLSSSGSSSFRCSSPTDRDRIAHSPSLLLQAKSKSQSFSLNGELPNDCDETTKEEMMFPLSYDEVDSDHDEPLTVGFSGIIEDDEVLRELASL